MSDCAARARRRTMTDAEFWADVAESLQPTLDDHDDHEPGPSDVIQASGRCPECGEPGACGWDALGRPLIHATQSTSEDDR
jgi:hypothetical protein